jgi:hypothetical protein
MDLKGKYMDGLSGSLKCYPHDALMMWMRVEEATKIATTYFILPSFFSASSFTKSRRHIFYWNGPKLNYNCIASDFGNKPWITRKWPLQFLSKHLKNFYILRVLFPEVQVTKYEIRLNFFIAHRNPNLIEIRSLVYQIKHADMWTDMTFASRIDFV